MMLVLPLQRSGVVVESAGLRLYRALAVSAGAKMASYDIPASESYDNWRFR